MAEPTSFIKLDRNIINWRWYGDANTLRLFMHLLLKANYEDRDWHNITIHRGELVTSVSHLSDELGLSDRAIRVALDHLKMTNEVTNFPTPRYTVITINNYEKYQSVTSSTTNKRQTNDKLVTTTKEVKEIEENNMSPLADATGDLKKVFELDSKPYRCAQYLADKITERIPGRKINERTLQIWADSMDKLNRIDNQDWQTIAAVLDFSQQDLFWQTNILSGKKLREKFDQLYLKMKQEENK